MNNKIPDISIITPSLNMLPYLRRCAASIGDQEGVISEHIVVDACSTDGTVQWLDTKPAMRYISEKDKGMYDAINKGLRMAQSEIVAYLNCDEQYLPGTLKYVKDFFSCHPKVDLIFGGTLLTRPDGSLISYRKSYKARWVYILSDHLYLLTCSMFWRKKLTENEVGFDPNYKAAGDAEFVARVLRAGFTVANVKPYFSIFTMTGQNLNMKGLAHKENEKLFMQLPYWTQKMCFILKLIRRIEKLIQGAYCQKFPITYEIYVGNDLNTRKKLIASSASFSWKTS